MADGKGTFIQNVRVELAVRVDPGNGDFNNVDTDELQEAIEQLVKNRLGYTANSAIEVYARRGPGGYRYFYPGENIETDVTVPIRTNLDRIFGSNNE